MLFANAPIGLSVEDTSAQKTGGEDLRREDREHRNTLVREVQHRIKNSLQGVIGLLHQHAFKHPELKPVMGKAISKVSAIAPVHGLHTKDAADADRSLIRIKVWRSGGSAVVSVENNCLALPRDFSFERGQGIDTGLSLVKSLMPGAGAALEFQLEEHQILCARLRLWPPVVYS
jgi:hypothetical protein